MNDNYMNDNYIEGPWSIQRPLEEGETASYLLYKGVMVGRLYGGCPFRQMLDKLNDGEEVWTQ